MDEAEEKIALYIAHRQEREDQIMKALSAATGSTLSSFQVGMRANTEKTNHAVVRGGAVLLGPQHLMIDGAPRLEKYPTPSAIPFFVLTVLLFYSLHAYL